MGVQKSNIVIKHREKRKRVNQVPYGIALLIIIIGLGLYFYNLIPRSGIFWGFGIVFGFILQKTRFCFTASMRDPALTGSTSITKAVLVAIAIASAGFAVIEYNAISSGLPNPGDVSPWGFNTVVGAILFGIGMVIAGGCASGTLMRVGEGFGLQFIALAAFIVGSLWGAHDFGWWIPTFAQDPIFLPDLLGWGPALVVQFGLLGILYGVAHWYGKGRSE